MLVFEYVDYDMKKYLSKFKEKGLNQIAIQVNPTLSRSSLISFSKAYNTFIIKKFYIGISSLKIY